MSAPHEETWAVDDVIVLYNRDDGQKSVREILGRAAPELARALISVHRPASVPACWCPLGYDTKKGHTMQCDNARNTLKRAGVPLP